MKTTSQRQGYEKAGRRAETLACWYLRLKGYRIIARRFKTKQGEIDIAAIKRNIVAIIEVKQRASDENILDSVSFENSQRLMNAAEIFHTRSPDLRQGDYELRFDIIHVVGRWKITHIKDAFRGY